MSQINVVPYVDVMLVLLVIFMITAPILKRGVKVNLPQATAHPIPNPHRAVLVVTVDRRGRYFLDGHFVTPTELAQRASRLLRLRPHTPVLIRGDRAVPYQDVVRAMVLLQQAGAPSVGLMTKTRGS
ncbi:MAG TPA: protein TolR [Acidiferrobacter sp.]|nr:protein TolR [Acidiferrobacter sp.]